MWIGIDDTDSPRGGCTTWALTELLRSARDADVDLIGEPRLVRLNPNIPWKTRGNAALAARFGRGSGRRRRLGEIDRRPVWSYARGRPLPAADADDWRERAWRCVRGASRRGEPGTDPALVAVERPLPAALYWAAVRDVVPVADVRALLERRGAFVRVEGTPRGLVGASAAIAWPGRRRTWELIAYRQPRRWGSPRDVDAASVRAVQDREPRLFLCSDPRTRRLLVAPHTPCPILYGLRGRDPVAPLRARRGVRSEPVDRWVLFRTNQGTGDHLGPWSAAELGPFRSARLTGVVVAPPTTIPGGHVRFPVATPDRPAIPCIAFEPTKTLPRVARTLAPGDVVRVWGGRPRDATLHVEGIEIVRLAPRYGRGRAPRCPTCDRTAGSMGRDRGYRCPKCRHRWPPEAARRAARAPEYGPGTYHPTPSARRHLAPLGPEP